MGYFRCDPHSKVGFEHANTRPDFARMTTVSMLSYFFAKLNLLDHPVMLKRLPTFVRVLNHYHVKRRRSLRYNMFQDMNAEEMCTTLNTYLITFRHDLLTMNRYGSNYAGYFHTPHDSTVIDLVTDDNVIVHAS